MAKESAISMRGKVTEALGNGFFRVILENEMDQESSTNQKYVYQAQIDKLKHNNKVQIHNWEKLNNKFQNGLVTVKPSNLSIANILGICERQVSYYIMCAKNGKTDLSDIYKRLEEMDKD